MEVLYHDFKSISIILTRYMSGARKASQAQTQYYEMYNA